MPSRQFFLTLFLFFGIFLAEAYGLIPVMNYQRADYAFGTQNWDMVQDERGKVYVANYNGMMEFDGQRWRHYYLPNYSTIRSLLYDPDTERIYAGGTEELGYFSSSPDTGILTYTSLKELMSPDILPFTEVWDIIKLGNKILFRCDNCIFNYDGKEISRQDIDGRISSTAHIGRNLYVGCEDGSLYSLRDGDFSNFKKEDCSLVEKKIVAILPFDDNTLLLCTPLDGLYKWKFSGDLEDYKPEYESFLKDNQLFTANRENGVYVYGTVTGGALVVDTNNGLIDIIDKNTGLKNNTVLKVRFDRHSNLWLCLDNGIAYASLDSPCRRMIGENEFIGAGYAFANFNGRIFLGTNQGLYSCPERSLSESEFNKRKRNLTDIKLEIPGQVWGLTRTGEEMFVASDQGMYVYDKKGYEKVDRLPGVYKVLALPDHPDMALASTYESFHLLKKEGGRWKDKGKVSGGNDLKGNFLIDPQGRVWVDHWQKGVYLLVFNIEEERFTSCRLFDKSSGLPENDNNTFAFFEGVPVSSTYTGFYTLNPANMKATSYEELAGILPEGRRGHLREIEGGSLVLVDQSGVLITRRTPEGNLRKMEISGPGLYHETIPGFTDVSRFSQDELLVSTQNGFTIVDTRKGDLRHDQLPFISRIYANHDSLIYQSPLSLNRDLPLELPPEFNSLRFEFAYPECNFGENTVYSSYLENYDKEWSPFSAESSREYTRLSDGDYVLHLKVRDNYTGEILESSFGFTVAPPWFRSAWAKSIYTVLSFLFLFMLFFSVKKRMTLIRSRIERKKEKEMEDLRMESERETMRKDVEIAGLKNEQLEQEIKYKSDELSSTTMSLINKNEILREIGDQITQIQKTAGEVPLNVLQRHLSKIKTIIDENISKDTDWNTFNKNFDSVYGDYVKRLMRLHPGLTQSEKRLCCYIRMGLSSKEIAPLINISFRSVEMARYRLRKKMNLAPEAGLSEYLSTL